MKVAIVTGGTKGIGKATVLRLLKEGCKVYTSYSSDEISANKLIQSCGSMAENLNITKVDLSDLNAAMDYIEEIIEKESGRIDYLIFNAGGTLKKPFGEIEYQEWIRCFDLNLNIPFFMIQKVANNINENGRIIFVSSIMSIYEHSGSIAYGVSKASLNSLTQYLVKYFCKQSITVNSIITGFTNTTMIQRTSEHINRIENKIALKRFAEPEEIAQFIWHVIEDGYVNGSLMEIDGGYCYQ